LISVNLDFLSAKDDSSIRQLLGCLPTVAEFHFLFKLRRPQFIANPATSPCGRGGFQRSGMGFGLGLSGSGFGVWCLVALVAPADLLLFWCPYRRRGHN